MQIGSKPPDRCNGFAVDGRAGDRMPRGSSQENPQGQDPQAEIRSAGRPVAAEKLSFLKKVENRVIQNV